MWCKAAWNVQDDMLGSGGDSWSFMNILDYGTGVIRVHPISRKLLENLYIGVQY